MGIHVTEEYVTIINQDSHVSHHKHTLPDEDTCNATNKTFLLTISTGNYQHDYSFGARSFDIRRGMWYILVIECWQLCIGQCMACPIT